MRRNSAIKVTAMLLALVVVAGSLVAFTQYNSGSKTTASSNLYTTQTAKKSDISVSVNSTGTVFAAVTKDIVANNSGTLKDLNVKEGDVVTAGQKLFTSDSDQIRQQVSSAQINVEKQNLQLNKMKTDDDKNLQYLQIKDAKNNLNNANQQLKNMTVTSPINGVVTARNNNNGDSVQSGKAVLSIMDPEALKIKASVDELDISKIKVGQPVQVKFNAIEGKIYEGSVESISAVGTTSNNVTTYSVTVVLNDKTGVMLGMTANVSIMVESKKDVVTVPSEALVDRGGKKYVMVPADNTDTSKTQPSESKENSPSSQQKSGTYTANANSSKSAMRGANSQAGAGMPGKLVEVKVGIQNETLVEITEGISEGQKVMISLPQISSSTSKNTNTTSLTKNMGGIGGSFGGGAQGGSSRAGSSNK